MAPVVEITEDELDPPTVEEITADQLDSGPSPDTTFFNQGIARSVGAPVDLTNGLLSLIPIVGPYISSTAPVGGSASIEAGFRALEDASGETLRLIPRAGEQPQTPGAFAARGVGDVGGSLGLLGPASSLTRVGAGAVGRLAQAPARGLGAEILAGSAAGIGAYGSTLIPDDAPVVQLLGRDNVEMLGELLGGFGAVSGTLAAGTTAKFAPTALALRGIKKTVIPFTKAGAFPRAAKRAQGLAQNPEEAARLALRPSQTGANLTPATRTGDPALLALEKSVRDKNIEIDRKINLGIYESREALAQSIRAMTPGDAQALRQNLGARRQALFDLLSLRARQAGLAAEERIALLGPDITSEEAQRIIRQEIEEMEVAARATQRQLWGAVPDTALATPTQAREAYMNALTELTPEDAADTISPSLRKFFGTKVRALGDGGFELTSGTLNREPAVAAKRLQAARSEILREIREENAKDAPNRNKIRILGNIEAGLWEDMQGVEGGEIYNTAREFSALLNDKFTRGAVGRTLGYDVRGGGRVSPGATLDVMLPARDVAGDNIDQILMALEKTGVEDEVIKQYILGQFKRSVMPDGQLNARAAQVFLAKNEALLGRFPNVRGQIEGALDAQARAAAAASRTDRATRLLTDPRRSTTAAILNTRVGEEVSGILRAQDPRRAARNAVRLTKGQPEAREGLKAAFTERILAATDARGMRRTMSDRTFQDALREVMTTSERGRQNLIIKEFEKIAAQEASRALPEGIIRDAPNTALSIVARIFGARAGGQMGGTGGLGGGLQSANIISRQARRLLERLTNDQAERMLIDAVNDPALFADLLLHLDRSKRAGDRVAKRLNLWLAGIVAPGTGEEENGR